MSKLFSFDAETTPFSQLTPDERAARLLAYAPRNLALFREQFNALVEAEMPEGHSFDDLEAAWGNPQTAIEKAIDTAKARGVMDQLAQRIAVAVGPEARERVLGFGSRSTIAIAEGVFDAKNGLTDTKVLYNLCEVNRAVCLVRYGPKAVGTGLLIDNDLVLTAAHVFEQNGYNSDGSMNSDLQEKIQFQFYGPDGDLPQTARLATQWQVVYKRSCVMTVADGSLPDDAISCLDFILVKLDKAIAANIPPIRLNRLGRIPKQLSAIELTRRYYILGYAGGSDAKFGQGNIIGINDPAARILHKVDSTHGMSGSPLLDDSARVIGLHEARITDSNKELLHNRAVMLRTIASVIEAARRTVQPAPPFVQSAAVRKRWALYVVQHATPKLKTLWAECLKGAGVGPQGEGPEGSQDHFYPIFEFPTLQAWLDLPTAAIGTDRVLCVEGEPGRGKSFALQYARTRYGEGSSHTIDAAVSSGSSIPNMLPMLCPGGMFDDATRPAEGRLRSHADSVLTYFESIAALAPGKHLLVIVDLDPEGAYWDDTYRFWRELAVLCLVRSSLRLLLCGPSAQLRNELNLNNIGSIACPEIDLATVRRHCQSAAEQLDKPDSAKWAGERASQLWDQGRPGRIDSRFATCDAARIVMQVRHELTTGGNTDAQPG